MTHQLRTAPTSNHSVGERGTTEQDVHSIAVSKEHTMCLSRLSQLQIERVEPICVKGSEYTVNVSRDYTQYSILQWKFYDNKTASGEWVNEM